MGCEEIGENGLIIPWTVFIRFIQEFFFDRINRIDRMGVGFADHNLGHFSRRCYTDEKRRCYAEFICVKSAQVICVTSA